MLPPLFWPLTKPPYVSGWRDLRDKAPVFALSLIFAPAQHRDVLSDIWLLHLECRKAASVTSETLLGMMRLQWLSDAVENQQSPTGDDVLARIAQYDEYRDFFTRLIICWRDSFEMPSSDKHTQDAQATSGCLLLMAELISGDLTDAQKNHVQQIGAAIAHSQSGAPVQNTPEPGEIRRQFGRDAGWLLAAAYVAEQAEKRNVSEDNLLIFRLCWHVIRHMKFS